MTVRPRDWNNRRFCWPWWPSGSRRRSRYYRAISWWRRRPRVDSEHGGVFPSVHRLIDGLYFRAGKVVRFHLTSLQTATEHEETSKVPRTAVGGAALACTRNKIRAASPSPSPSPSPKATETNLPIIWAVSMKNCGQFTLNGRASLSDRVGSFDSFFVVSRGVLFGSIKEQS